MLKSQKPKNHYISDHLVVFLLIANSGLPFFTNEPYLLVGSMLLTVVFVKKLAILKRGLFIGTIVFLSIIVFGQSITTNIFDLRTTLTLFVRWVYPFLVLAVVKDRLPKLFVNVMFFLTVVSLLLFIPSAIFPMFETFLLDLANNFDQVSSNRFYSYNPNLFIYTIKPGYAMEGLSLFKRNSGPFWEAGGFGSYLILALLFNLLLEKKLLTKRNVIFILALITTWSTGALAALSALLFLYGTFILRNKNYRFIIVPMVVLLSFYGYTDLSFIKERIDRSVTYFKDRNQTEYQKRDRMVSAIVDLRTFVQYPVFGTGRKFEARFGKTNMTIMEHRNNGITDFLVKYGIFFFIFYFWNIRKGYLFYSQSYTNKPKIYGNIALITILLIGFSQTLFQQSAFIALFYLSSFLPKPGLNKI